MNKDDISIRRAPRNAQHPYMQLFRKVPQDLSLTLEARGFLIYILSLPKVFLTNMTDMGKDNGIGRDKTRKLLRQLQIAGYCKQFGRKDSKGRFDNLIYYFSEDKYFDMELIYQELSYPLPENRKADNEHFQPSPEKPSTDNESPVSQHGSLGTETDPIHTIDNKTLKSKETPPIPPEPKANAAKAAEAKKKFSSQFDAEVLSLSEAVLSAVVAVKPDYAIPVNLTPIRTSLDLMIRVDKRDPQMTLNVLRWALADSFWCDKMFKPNPAKYLREKFDQLEMKMKAKPEKKARTFLPSSDDDRALKEWQSKGAIY